ncbi:MAG TPA: hypothetical protein VGA40_08245 [Candidatus Acidoferrales bacterium]
MKKMNRFVLMTGFVTLTLLLAGCSSTTEANEEKVASGANAESKKGFLARLFSSSTPVVVAEGTLISVTLDQALSSESNNAGDGFDASVSSPIVVNGKTVIPQGARVRGVVVDAQSSGRLKTPGRLELTLTSIEVDGTRYNIDTSDTTRSGKSHTKHNVIFIGGGTATGAILGAIIGGGKGAAIGSAIGAGGGTAAAAATGKMNVHLPAETRLAFPLSQSVTIQVKD